MNEQTAYILIAAAAICLAIWQVRRLSKSPPAPSHLEDLEAELRLAQRDSLAELKMAERSAALAEVYNQRVRWIMQEIEREQDRIRPNAERNGGVNVPSKGSLSAIARA